MKFGKKILAEQIPGWSHNYLDYKALKKIVSSLNAAHHPAPPPSLRSSTGPSTFDYDAPQDDPQNQQQLQQILPPSLMLVDSLVSPQKPPQQPLLWDAPPSFLAATPTITTSSQLDEDRGHAFQTIKARFFFRLQRELDKINTFYLQKEAEVKLRLATLLSKQRAAVNRIQLDFDEGAPIVEHVEWRAVEEGFRLLHNDLLKLQQFVDINATGFQKILKKWDKRSKSTTKELYLARQVEVQPVFNRQLISQLADTVAASLLDLTNTTISHALQEELQQQDPSLSERLAREQFSHSRAYTDFESDLKKAVASKDSVLIERALVHATDLSKVPDGPTHVTRILWRAAIDAPANIADLIMNSPSSPCDFQFVDDINGRTCLHEAAAAGELRLVNLCLDKGVEVNRKDVYGRTALHYASIGGHVNICKRLIAAGGNSATLDLDNYNALYYAVIHGHLECARVLLEVGSDRLDSSTTGDINPLALACQGGHLDVVTLLLRHGAKSLPNTNGEYPIHLAAKAGHADVCQLLANQSPAQLDLPDKYNEWSPLFHAARNGRHDALRVLLEAGCNPIAVDEFGKVPVFYSAWHGHIQCVKLLLEWAGEFPARHDGKARSSVALPSANMSPLELGMSGIDTDTIPSLSLPPPIMPFRIYGHNYLEKNFLVQLALGSPFSSIVPSSAAAVEPQRAAVEITPWTTDPEMRRPYSQTQPPLKLVVTSRSQNASIPVNIALPLNNDQDVTMFQITSMSDLSLEFSFYPSYGSKTIGRAAVLPSVFDNIEDTKVIHLPVLDHKLHIIGKVTFEVCIIKPFGDEISQIVGDAIPTYWKSTAHSFALSPGLPPRILTTSTTSTHTSPSNSNHSIAAQGSDSVMISSLNGDFLKVVVQVTRDLVPVVCDESWRVPVEGLDLGVADVTLKQFLDISASAGRDLKSATSPTSLQQWGNIVRSAMIPLEALLTLLPVDIGVMLHVAYPDRAIRKEYGLGHAIDLNTFVEAILKTVYRVSVSSGGSIPSTSPRLRRQFAFLSFYPPVCTALNWKQPNYAVFFGSQGGLSSKEHGGLDPPRAPNQVDWRCTSISSAIEFAKANNLLGVFVNAFFLCRIPSLTQSIKDSGVLLGAYGTTEDVNLARSQKSNDVQPQGVDATLLDGVVHFVDQSAWAI